MRRSERLGLLPGEAVFAECPIEPIAGPAYKANGAADVGLLNGQERNLAERSQHRPGLVVLTSTRLLIVERNALRRPVAVSCAWAHDEVAGLIVKPRGSAFLLSVVFIDRSILRFEAARSGRPMRLDDAWNQTL